MRKHHFILITLLLLALACYLSGFMIGSVVFFVIGLILEAAFWIRLLWPKSN